MTLCWRCWYWKLGLASWLALGGAIASFGDCALAQITPDGTLGAESSVVTPTAPGENVDVIQGGATRGANLFHSFEQFSVLTGREAYFNNALDIQNIISRVTGSSISNIDGLLRANGAANLFLLNPNGIIFGKNASLNVGGSFVATTANAIQFGNQGFFSASNPNTPPLLTVNPSAFLFNQIAAAPIQNNSVAPAGLDPSGSDRFGLRVPDGRSLLLVGGNISMDGSGLNAFGGRVELGGLAGAGTVGLNVDGKALSLSFLNDVERADVSLSNDSRVDVRAGGGGSIAINARSLDVSGESRLVAGIQGLGTASSQAGDITLNATEVIRVKQLTGIANQVRSNGTGNSGDIIITTGSLFVTDGSQLLANTDGQGDAGSIIINARDRVSFDGISSDGFATSADSRVEDNSRGKGGDIRITTGSLSVTNGAALITNTNGQGDAGSVIINARESVSFDGESGAFSDVEGIGRGRGGDIRVTAGSLSVTNGAQLVAVTRGQGEAGNIIIDTRESVSFDEESAAFSEVTETGRGQGGDIRVTTGSLSVTNGAQLIADTNGKGDAGNVIIDARNTVSLQGVGDKGFTSLISTDSESEEGEGGRIKVSAASFHVADGAIVDARTSSSRSGGSITINVNTFEATNGGQVTTTTDSIGQAGNINLNVTGSVTLSGSDLTYADRLARFGDRGNVGAASGLIASTNSGAQGKGGNIFVNSSKLTVQDNARIAVNSQGTGEGGSIKIQAGNLTLKNQALISAETVSSQGGDITIGLQDILLLRRGSQISTTAGTARAGGDGGIITINSPFIVVVPSEDSNISANAFSGKGGIVNITAQGIFGIQPRQSPTSMSDITASSQFGVSGEVTINTLDIDPSQGLINLPAELVDVSGLIAQGCPGGGGTVGRGVSEFIITGRGGLPPSPSSALRTDAVRVDLGTPIQGEENRSSAAPSTNSTRVSAITQIVEAQGWVYGPNGEVILTATAPTATLNIPWVPSVDCHTP